MRINARGALAVERLRRDVAVHLDFFGVNFALDVDMRIAANQQFATTEPSREGGTCPNHDFSRGMDQGLELTVSFQIVTDNMLALQGAEIVDGDIATSEDVFVERFADFVVVETDITSAFGAHSRFGRIGDFNGAITLKTADDSRFVPVGEGGSRGSSFGGSCELRGRIGGARFPLNACLRGMVTIGGRRHWRRTHLFIRRRRSRTYGFRARYLPGKFLNRFRTVRDNTLRIIDFEMLAAALAEGRQGDLRFELDGVAMRTLDFDLLTAIQLCEFAKRGFRKLERLGG